MQIHPFVQLVFVFWFFGAIACFATKDSDPIGAAATLTLIAGAVYLFIR
jgi:hypothetical protein